MPVTIRIPCGGGIGAVEHHSESPEALFAHTAGLRVVACANSTDAYAMIQQSIRCDDPVIFFEPKRRYWDKAEVDPAADLAGGAAAGPGQDRAGRHRRDPAVLRADGPDLRGVGGGGPGRGTLGRGHRPALAVPAGHGDHHAASVRRTGRCVVAHEAPVTGGLGAEIAARITEECFYQLESPVLRVGGFSTPYPPSRLEDHYLPDLDRVLDAVDRTFTV